jgi:Holliday junction resolvase RusA-like endonuclease
MWLKLVVYGNPVTKKNSINLVDLGRQCPVCRRKAKTIPLPSKAFKAYEKVAEEQLYNYLPIFGEVSVKCLYWLPTARRPDLCNLLAASHDILEHCGIVENDKQIRSVDGSRIMGKDAEQPRVEIWIEPFEKF